ncbi:MAG: helix-turn-helix domain-containing protein [Sneathiella sp.]|nr:helix-turn-helix domain-containing protein [Sneathiella sp.]
MFSIGQMSKQTHVKIPTIRYYEQMGLIAPPVRTEGNQRRYSQAALERLSFIKHARDLGLTIEAIRDLTDLSAHPEKPCADAHRIAKEHLASVRERIAKLQRLEVELARIEVGCDTGQMESCYVIQALADHSLCVEEH